MDIYLLQYQSQCMSVHVCMKERKKEGEKEEEREFISRKKTNKQKKPRTLSSNVGAAHQGPSSDFHPLFPPGF